MTIDMEHDAEILKNEMVKDKLPAFEEQTLEATNTAITGLEPAMCQFLFLKLVSAQKHCS